MQHSNVFLATLANLYISNILLQFRSRECEIRVFGNHSQNPFGCRYQEGFLKPKTKSIHSFKKIANKQNWGDENREL